jgi:hypothetical protein
MWIRETGVTRELPLRDRTYRYEWCRPINVNVAETRQDRDMAVGHEGQTREVNRGALRTHCDGTNDLLRGGGAIFGRHWI